MSFRVQPLRFAGITADVRHTVRSGKATSARACAAPQRLKPLRIFQLPARLKACPDVPPKLVYTNCENALEIPDPIFRRAKAKAAEQKIPLRRFVSDAVAEKLEANSPERAKARARVAGGLRHMRKENARINRVIDREFERIEPEEWA